jgi:predicted Fe-S protein YdhL (DUF1289 family)
MVTPCVGNCVLDPLTAICKGCKRTHEEVQDWYGYTDEQRLVVMKRLGFGKRMGREERLRRYERG